MAIQFNSINYIHNNTISGGSMISYGSGQQWLILLRRFIREQDKRNEAIHALLQTLMDMETTKGTDILPEIMELQKANVQYLNVFKEVIKEEPQDEGDEYDQVP